MIDQKIVPKTYLGDSVYAKLENGMIVLTTENGYSDDPRNVICLEPSVYQALVLWVTHLMKRQGAL
jgi:hypothetical protein